MPSKAPSQFNMDEYAWSHRPVLVFADQVDSPELRKQLQLFQPHEAGLAERQNVVIVAAGDRVTVSGEIVSTSPQALRERYGLDPNQPFAVLLIGKDTGVKLHRTQPVTAQTLFALIDTMPMRRQEMRSLDQ